MFLIDPARRYGNQFETERETNLETPGKSSPAIFALSSPKPQLGGSTKAVYDAA
jgi:hypothetical protein